MERPWVATLATPEAPSVATLATCAACVSARPLVSVSGWGAGATLRGQGDGTLGVARHTYTRRSPHHQRHPFSADGPGADAPPAGANW